MSDFELETLTAMDRGASHHLNDEDIARLNKRVVRKLDLILLPFLSLLFLVRGCPPCNCEHNTDIRR